MTTTRRTKRACKFNRRNLDALQPEPVRYRVWSTEVPGLVLRVSTKGAKTFGVVYRNRAGRSRDYTIGAYPLVSVAEARSTALSVLADVRQGLDPVQIRSDARMEARAAATGESITTLGVYLHQGYPASVRASHRDWEETVRRVSQDFEHLLNRQMESIRPVDIKIWRDKALTGVGYDKPLAIATINRRASALKGVLNQAVEDEVITRNPLAGIRPLKGADPAPERVLTPTEEAKLLRAADEWGAQGDTSKPMKALIVVALDTGLRRGEILSLQWRDFDRDAKTLTVRVENAKSKVARTVPLTNRVVNALLEQQMKTGQRKPDALVFTAAHGGRLRSIGHAWQTLLQRAGIPKIRFHDLRHTAASRMRDAGVPLQDVGDILGHASPNTTARYSHGEAHRKREAIDKLEQYVTTAGNITD